MPTTLIPRFKAAERRAIVIDLSRKGLTFPQIAQAMHAQYPDKVHPNYDQRHAYRDVKWCLQNIRVEMALPTEERREMETQRLDGLRAVYGLKALQGDHKSLDSLLKVMDKYALLHGLYKAAKREDVLTVESVMPMLDAMFGIMNQLSLAWDGRMHVSDTFLAQLQQRLEAMAAAAPGMALLMQGQGAPASASAPETS